MKMTRCFVSIFVLVMFGTAVGYASMPNKLTPDPEFDFANVGDDDQIVDDEATYDSECRNAWEGLNPDTVLVRSVVAISPSRGRIWRADYVEVLKGGEFGEGASIKMRVAIWQSGPKKGMEIWYTLVESRMKPLP